MVRFMKVPSNDIFKLQKRSIALVVTLAMSLYVGGVSAIDFVQTDWSGGATANGATDPVNQTGWVEYSSADAGINNATDLTIVPSAGFVEQTRSIADFKSATNILSHTSSSDFSAGALLTNTQVLGGMIMSKPAGKSANWVAKSAWDFTAPVVGPNAGFSDLDGDGDLDMLVATNQALYGYRNTGDGDTVSWVLVTEWGIDGATLAWKNSRTIALYDLDSDGDVDLLLSHNDQPVQAWENTGSGDTPVVWTRRTEWDLTSGTQSTAQYRIGGIVDLDGLDGGKPELFVGGVWSTNSWQNTPPDVYTFDYSLLPSSPWLHQAAWRPTGTYSRSPRAAVGDFDNDNDPDLLIGWQNQANLQSLPNSSSGYPVTPVWQDDGLTGPVANNGNVFDYPSLGDIDHDGDLDLFIGHSGSTTMLAYENIGSTYFTSATYTSDVLDSGTGNVGYTTVDYTAVIPANTTLTLDMRSGSIAAPDASWTAWSTNSGIANGGDISGLGDGRYVQYRFNFSTSDTTVSAYVKAISINFSAYPSANNVFTYNNKITLALASRTLSWNEASNDWSIAFNGSNAYVDSNYNNQAPAVGDLDGDGWADLVMGDSNQSTVTSVYRNNGDNTWTYTPAWNVPYIGTNVVPTLGDLDGDGDLDLLIGKSSSGTVTAFRNDGGVSGPPNWQVAPVSWNINHSTADRANAALADLDNDGDLDAIVAHTGNSQTSVVAYENQSVGSGPVWVTKSAWNPSWIGSEWVKVAALGDVDGDGDYDLLIAGQVGINSSKLLINVGTPETPEWQYSIADTDPQVPPALQDPSNTAFYDLDNDGDLDALIGYNGNLMGRAMTGASSYAASGNFTSAVMDFNGKTLTTMDYSATVRGDSTLMVSVRAGDTVAPGAFWTAWSVIANGGSIAAFDSYRYLQYKIDMVASTGNSLTPVLTDITFNYTSLPSLVTLISSPYNTTVAGNFVTGLAWNESLATGADIQVQLRSSSDNSIWTAWMGPDSTSGSYWNSADTHGGSCSGTGSISCGTIASSLKDGANDQWFQYKTSLVATTLSPTLSDITLSYASSLPAGITLSQTTGLAPNEASTSDSFTVVLDSAPSADVTISLTSTVPSEAVPTTSVLTFTTVNWATPQLVDVVAVNDAVDDGDTAFSILLDPGSSDGAYNALSTLSVFGFAIDDDTANISLSGTFGLIVTEASQSSDSFSVVLDSEPTADVTMSFSSADTTEGTVLPASVTFTPATWNVAKTITVTGVDEGFDDGDIIFNIVTGAAVSGDSNYHGMNSSDVNVTNQDNDTATILVNPVTTLTTTEDGGQDSFTVVLGSQPSSNVTIFLSSSNLSEGTLNYSFLTFTSSNWNTPQTVTVTGRDDGSVDGDLYYTVSLSNASSGDPAYDQYDLPDITAVNSDNDIASVIVTPSVGLTTGEDGSAATVSVKLGALPIALVTLNISVSDASEGLLSTTALVYNSGTWDIPQTITVTGVDDLMDDGDQLYTVSIGPAAGSDAVYAALSAVNVSITNIDNDGAAFSDSAFNQSNWQVGLANNEASCLAINGTWTGIQCVAVSPGNQAGWQSYSNKHPGIEVINSGADLRAQVVSKTMSLTSNADFGLAGGNKFYTTYADFISGSVSNTKINNGAISLKPQVSTTAWASTANTAWNQTVGSTGANADFSDLDGDGDLDMMVAANQWLYGYRNIGTDTSPVWELVSTWGKTSLELGYQSAHVVALGDLDGDGDYDMLLARQSLAIIAYENQGTTTSPNFQRQSDWDMAAGSAVTINFRLALGQLDGDVGSKPDLLLGGQWSNGTVEAYEFDISLAAGSKWVRRASWDTPSGLGYPAGPKPTIGDLDEDGDPDLVFGWSSRTDLQIVTNLNTGFSSTPNTWSETWGGATGLAGAYDFPTLVDIDSDGDLDLMIGASDSANLVVYENTTTQYFSSGIYTSAAIDVGSHDGFDTLTFTATTPAGTNLTVDMRAADDASFLSNSTGWLTGFATAADISALGNRRYVQYRLNLSTSNSTATPVLSDLAFSILTYPLVTNTVAAGNALILKILSRTHAWTREPTWDHDVTYNSDPLLTETPDSNVSSPSPALADMDGDGDLDLIRGDGGTFAMGLYENDGSNVWSYRADWNLNCCGTSSNSTEVRLADLDNDGDQDAMLFSNLWSSVVAYENLGTDRIPQWNDSSPSAQKGAWAIIKGGVTAAGFDLVDMDLDGDLDAMVGDHVSASSADRKILGFENVGSNTNPAWLAKAEWNLAPAACSGCATDWWLPSPAMADIDGDGDQDMIVSNGGRPSYAFENIGSATVPIWNRKAAWDPDSIDPADSLTYARMQLEMADLDGDADVDLLVGGDSSKILAYRNTGVTDYVASGSYESEILDFGSHLGFTTVDYNATIRTGTSLTVELRSGNTVKPDGSWSAWAVYANAADISAYGTNRYVQYKVNMTANGTTDQSPSFYSIDFNYTGVEVATALTSSAYDSISATNLIKALWWTESLVAGSDVQVQLRAAPDSAGDPGTWSEWVGPDGSSSSYWNSSNTYAGACSGSGAIVCSYIPPVLRNGLNNQWLQYKVTLVSTGDVQAMLSDIAVFYASGSDGSAVITMTPTSVTTTEDSGVTPTATFNVTLTGTPTANVDIYFDSEDVTEGTVAPAQLTFSSGDMGPKTVAVTAVDDAVRDGNISYQIFTSATVSTDASFDALIAPDVTVTNTDDDNSLGAVYVSPTSGLITTEGGGAATFNVVLATAPTADVRISLSTSDSSEGIVSPTTLLFTSVNWNVAQTATVTGLDDTLFDQTIAYTVVTGAVASSDANYTGMVVPDVSVSNTDDDAAAVTITPDDLVNGLTVNENGGARTFAITLSSQPTANVMFTLSTSDSGEAVVLPFTMLIFTPTNWNVPQPGTVFGVEDNLIDGDVPFNIVTSPFMSFGDPNFNGIDPPDYPAINQDNDGVYGINIWPSTTVKTAESGNFSIINFELTSKPTADVIIDLSVSDIGEAYIQERIILKPDDITWRGVTVKVIGVDDDIVDTDQPYTIITATSISADPNFHGIDPIDIPAINVSTNYKALELGQGGAYTGRSVAMGDVNGDGYADLVFGAPGYDGSFSNAGQVTVRYGQGGNVGLVSSEGWRYNGAAVDDGLGQSVAVSDVNNDGYSDLIVGAPGAGSGGAVYIFHGSSTGPSSTPDRILTHATVGANFGHAVAAAGKLNNDLYGDIIIGAYGVQQAYVYQGSSSGIPASAATTLTGAAASQFGISVASAGDLNGDGFDDLIVGADRYDNGETDEGAAFVYHGSSSGVVNSADWTMEVNQSNAYFGFAVAGAGDVNGDGYDDVVIGAYNYDNVQTDEGRIYLYHGSASGLAGSFAILIESNQDGALYGYAVASAGDVNNDGYGDIIVGAPSFDNVEADEGRATVYFGSSTGLDPTPQIEVESDQVGANFGVSVAGGGSIDVDNYHDFSIGADLYDGSQTDEGRAYIYRAPPSGAGVLVTPTTGLQTTEAGFGGTVSYTLVLTTPPTDTVYLESFSGDASEGLIVSAALLVFTPANWNSPQTIMVRGVDDFVDDGDVFYDMITLARSNDLRYDGFAVDKVTIMNVNDEYSVSVDATDAAVGETGPDSGTFTFSRTGDISGALTVQYSIAGTATNGADYTTLSSSLTMSAGQRTVDIIVTPVDDAVVDGGETVTITLDDIGTYELANNSTASITIVDNDAAGITVTSASGLQTTEAGASASFTVVLNTAPSASVTIGLSTDITTEGSVSPSSLTFTTGNWNVPQTVTAIGVDDAVVDGDALYYVVTATAVSGDSSYGGVINPIDVAVTNIDDDVLSNVTISTTVTNINEGGNVKGEFTISRTGDTAAALLVGYSVSGSATTNTDFYSLGASAEIPAGSRVVQVPVVVINDTDLEGDETVIISLTSSSSYVLDLPNQATVSIIDDDQLILPKVNFSLDQTVDEGDTVTVTAHLDKDAQAYPVNIPYIVSGSAANPADHNAASGTIVISSGRIGSLIFNVVSDATGEADETVVFSLDSPSDVVAGVRNNHTVTIVETNIVPRVTLAMTQGVANVALVSNADGQVTITATIDDPNPSDSHTYDWSATNNNLVDIDDGDPSTFLFDPVSLLNGFYKVRLTVTDDGAGLLQTEIDLLIEVVASLPALIADTDTDADGVNDVDEPYDLDSDGIVDYLDDAALESNELQLDVNSSGSIMRTDAGLSLRLGDTAFAAGADGALVTVADISAYGGGEGNAGSASATDTLANNGDYYDFEVSGLPDAGQSVRIVIPYTDALPAGAVYRKYDPVTGWSDFVIDGNNNVVASAPGTPSECPPPGAASFVEGLTAGHYCVQITIQDGGSNDQDGLANHVIEDPAQIGFEPPVVIVEPQPSTFSFSSSTGGGALSVWWFVLILWLLWLRTNEEGRGLHAYRRI